MQVVINNCYGGFSLSEEGTKAYWKRKGKECYAYGNRLFVSYFDVPQPEKFKKEVVNLFISDPEYGAWYAEHSLSNREMDRNDPDLIAVVTELGRRADGSCASLKIVEVPDSVEWGIEEYDGIEWVAEKHRTWS
jgi:hypothetical protein